MKQRTSPDNSAEARRMAATAARHGSRAMRSGRVDVPFHKEKRVAQRVLIEAQSAQFAWANWEAINDAMASKARNAALFLGLNSLRPIRNALARDAILTAYRISDPFDAMRDPDKISLCRIADVLSGNEIRSLMSSEQWAKDLGHPPGVAAWASKRNLERITRISERIVAVWGKLDPDNKEFFRLRTSLKPVRDKLLAHAIDSSEIPQPSIDEVRSFVSLTLDLATDAAFLLVGSAIAADEHRRFCRDQAERFWHLAFQSPVYTYQEQGRQIGFSEDSDG